MVEEEQGDRATSAQNNGHTCALSYLRSPRIIHKRLQTTYNIPSTESWLSCQLLILSPLFLLFSIQILLLNVAR